MGVLRINAFPFSEKVASSLRVHIYDRGDDVPGYMHYAISLHQPSHWIGTGARARCRQEYRGYYSQVIRRALACQCFSTGGAVFWQVDLVCTPEPASTARFQ
jgi:hypothetical protein